MTASNTINVPETLQGLPESCPMDLREMADEVAVLLDPARAAEWEEALDAIDRILSRYEDKPPPDEKAALIVVRARVEAGVWNPGAP